jgi:hypothetical protein
VRPRVRVDLLDEAFVLWPAPRRAVELRREGADGELCRTRDRVALAAALLNDILVEPPTRKLARDYSRFLPTVRDAPVRIAVRDVDDWLQTWQPAIEGILRKLR